MRRKPLPKRDEWADIWPLLELLGFVLLLWALFDALSWLVDLLVRYQY